MPTRRVAVYPGVFDPVHYGHLDIIERGAKLVDRLVVAVGDNPEKMPLFDQEERVELIKQTIRKNKDLGNVEVLPFKGLDRLRAQPQRFGRLLHLPACRLGLLGKEHASFNFKPTRPTKLVFVRGSHES